MKLLIFVNKVDRDDLEWGFFHGWILEFSKRVEELTVVCFGKGEYDFPENTRVIDLGKKSFTKFIYAILKYRKRYSSVFIYNNPKIILWGQLIWDLLGKKIYLWYSKDKVTKKLILSSFLVDGILTTSEERFELKTKKKIVLSHGIDTDFFDPHKKMRDRGLIAVIGRITSTKNLDLFLEVLNRLKDKGYTFRVRIVGSTMRHKDIVYLNSLKKQIEDYELQDRITFMGKVSYDHIRQIYEEVDIVVSLNEFHYLEKTILEAMSMNVKVLTLNDIFKDILPIENCTERDIADISNKLIDLINSNREPNYREYVIENQSLKSLIPRIVERLK
jgi:glycosyltransferase involved in cell wall biosynthesis